MINNFSILPLATVWSFTYIPAPGVKEVNCTATACHSEFTQQRQRRATSHHNELTKSFKFLSLIKPWAEVHVSMVPVNVSISRQQHLRKLPYLEEAHVPELWIRFTLLIDPQMNMKEQVTDPEVNQICELPCDIFCIDYTINNNFNICII